MGESFKERYLELKKQGKTDRVIYKELGLTRDRFYILKKESNLEEYFAVYRGDKFLSHGPISEIAWKFNIREKTLKEMARPSYYKRMEKAANPEEWLLAVKVEELTADDLEIKHRKRSGKH